MAYTKSKFTGNDPATGKRASMWTPKLERQVKKLYQQDGLKSARIAKIIGCSTMAVYNLLRNRGWLDKTLTEKRTSTAKKLNANPKRYERLHKTMSATELCREHGLHYKELIKWLKARGIHRTDQGERVRLAVKRGRHSAATKIVNKLAKFKSLDCDALHPLEYRHKARQLTGTIFKLYRHLIDPDQTRSYTIHVDHVFSLHFGVHKADGSPRAKRVPLWALCHPANLRMTPRAVNTKRHIEDATSHDMAALKRAIKRFNKKHGNPYDQSS